MTEDEMRYITTVGRMGSMSKAAEEMYQESGGRTGYAVI